MQNKEKEPLLEVILKNKLGIKKNIDSIIIKANGYSESEILKILNETHPEWQIIEIKNKENDPKV